MSNRRQHLYLLGLIFVGLVGVAALALPQSPVSKAPILGLDLQGGLEVVLEARPPAGRPLRENDLRRSETIIRDRIDRLGVAEPEVRRQGEDQISVQLAGVTDIERARDLIGKTAELQFYDLEGDLVPPSISRNVPIPIDNRFDLLAPVQSSILEGGGKEWRVFDPETKQVVAGPFATKAAAENSDAYQGRDEEDSEAGGPAPPPAEGGQPPESAPPTPPEDLRILGVPKNRIVLTCSIDTAVVCPPGASAPVPGVTYYYLFEYQPWNEAEPIPEMTGTDLRLQGTRQDFDPNTGEPIVLMQFTDDGEQKFGDITRELALRGKRLSFGGQDQFQHFAIVLDDEIRSWPSIDFNENPNGIRGTNGAQITGMAGLDEARDLAIVLQTGALPVEFVTLQETEISATLGEDSLRQAWQAAVGGLIAVAIFLLVFYRFLGLVAVLGLGIYAAFLYTVLLLFDVTLTLPGFAGMILTIGVAADANVVVFERIKEESRAGKSVRAAIASGYGKGFRTIIDANVVTAITALVLFSVATAGVKGFALMLLIGTAMSVVTAVFATRAMLGLLAGFRWFDSPAFMGAKARQIPPWQRIDIVGRRRIWFSIASVLIAISIGSLVWKGLNLGIDFEGGTEVGFTTPQPVQLEDVREAAGEVGYEGAFIQGVGAQVSGGYREFQIRTETLGDVETRQLTRAFQERIGAEATGARTVSGSFSDEILRGAIWAVVISFLLVSIYITIRFQWRFAVPILRTIVNDGLIALGVYAISGREVSAATVAAFLTIIGFSIYDTIIIFDRVRENLGIMKRATIKEIVNVSLWETIPRSLATTFITLLPVSVIFIFGGETLKDFAFAILIGIGVGAFSTIFIAAPFLAVLMERHPEYKRRKPTVPEEQPEELLEDAEALAASEPVGEIPLLAPVGDGSGGDGGASKRDRRRQRRKARPHGRAR